MKMIRKSAECRRSQVCVKHHIIPAQFTLCHFFYYFMNDEYILLIKIGTTGMSHIFFDIPKV